MALVILVVQKPILRFGVRFECTLERQIGGTRDG